MDAQERTVVVDFDQPIPIFPLNQCVLLPHARVPLHVFEPRYRAMTRDALDGPGLIAMAVFEGDRWKTDYTGNPPIRPHVCVGLIDRHERQPDGRYHLLLQGLSRARIVEEVEPHPDGYRLGRLRPTEAPEAMEIDLEPMRRQVDELLDDPVVRKLSAVHAIHRWWRPEVPTAVAVDLAGLMLLRDAQARYELLAEADPSRRGEMLSAHLRQTRATLRQAEKLGEPVSEDGYPLN